MLLKCFTLALVVNYCLVQLCADASADSVLRTVALAGDATSGNAFSSLGVPSLNDRGQSAYYITLGNDVDQLALAVEQTIGSSTIVAQTGDPAPGTEASIDRLFGSQSSFPTINNAGATAFRTGLYGPGVNSSNQSAIYRDAGGLELIVRTGDAVPGTDAGVQLGSHPGIVALSLNNLGETAFMTTLSGTGVDNTNDFGVFREDAAGGLLTVAREGDFVPQSSLRFSFPAVARDLYSVSLNDLGQTAFAALLTGQGVGVGNNMAIFSEGDGIGVEITARTGSLAPGTANDIDFARFGIPTLNNQGRTAFFAELTGPSVTESTDYGLFRETAGGDMVLVVRDGDTAPGLPAEVKFNFNYQVVSGVAYGKEGPIFNDADQTAFIASLTGTDSATGFGNAGVFREDANGNLSLVAHRGGEVPGRTDGARLYSFDDLALNNRGQAAFRAIYSLGTTDLAGASILAEDSAGMLQTIVSTGDAINVSIDPSQPDLRTISELAFAGDSGLNARGQIAFQAEFTDGTSGVFISNLVAVPEPASALLLASILLAFAGHRRSSRVW